MRPLIGIPCEGNLRSKFRRFCAGQSYCRAIAAAGGAPILLPLVDRSTLHDMYTHLDGILLTGGGDILPRYFGEAREARLIGVDRPRDEVELSLVRQAVKDGMPLLAICRGLQVLNVALGGTLYQDIPTQVPSALQHSFRQKYPRNYLGHEVRIVPGTRVERILGVQRLAVNSLHHQSLKAVAPSLVTNATAPDGVIEGAELNGPRFVVGVQWHPEELLEVNPRMLGFFEELVSAAGGVA